MKKLSHKKLLKKIEAGIPEVPQSLIKKELIRLIREHKILSIDLQSHINRDDDWCWVEYRSLTIDYSDN